MRSKYKKKRSIEQDKKENKNVEVYSKDFSKINSSKNLNPEIKIKYFPIFNRNINNNENSNKETKEIDINKENDLNKIENNNAILNIFKENNKNNNLLTSSFELKNKNISNYFNSAGKNYLLKVNQENKYNIHFLENKDKIIPKKNNENENKYNLNGFSQKNIFFPINIKNSKQNYYNNNPKNDITNNNSNKEIKIINKENFSSENVNMKINTKQSLKQLIHQAHILKELTDSFNKNYIPGFKKIKYKKSTYDPNIDKYNLDKDIYSKTNIKDKENNNNKKFSEDKKSLKLNIFKTEIISENDKNKYERNYIKFLYQNKKILNSNISKVNSEESKIKIERDKSSEKLFNLKLKNIKADNSNLYEKNNILLDVNQNNKKNYDKSLSEQKSDFNGNTIKNRSFVNLIPNKNISDNTELNKSKLRNNKYSAKFINSLQNNYSEENSKKSYKVLDIDLEEFYDLATKYKKILVKIKNSQNCQNECLVWINYYFKYKIFYKMKNIFKCQKNIYIITNYIIIEVICIFLFYNMAFQKNVSQIIGFIKDLVNLLYENFLFILIYINNNYDTNNKMTNNIFLNKKILFNKFNEIIEDENNIKSYKDEIKEEEDLISLLKENFQEINNYYQIIINNLYYSNYNSFLKDSNFLNLINYRENKNVISLCLKLNKNNLTNFQKIGLISLFFIDSIKTLNVNDFNFEDLLNIFETFLLGQEDRNLFNFYKNKNKTNNNNNKIKYRDFSSLISSPSNQFFLPPIKKGYKYTLVLDLDETLIYCRNESNQINIENKKNIYIVNGNFNNSLVNTKTVIMRPGLLEFLQNMKKIFELVLFSFGTCDYVNKIVNIIEKNEKYFEYILYRQHATFNDNIYIKNLSLLGRDLRNIIIVDDKPQVFKLHQNNGICIKPFFGDIVEDRNTLKILGNILQKIRFDVDEFEGDIRKSLKFHSDDIIYITSNLESN